MAYDLRSISISVTTANGSTVTRQGLTVLVVLRCALDAFESEYYNERVDTSSPEGKEHQQLCLDNIRVMEELLQIEDKHRFNPS